jgi:hypothetical protein
MLGSSHGIWRTIAKSNLNNSQLPESNFATINPLVQYNTNKSFWMIQLLTLLLSTNQKHLEAEWLVIRN